MIKNTTAQCVYPPKAPYIPTPPCPHPPSAERKSIRPFALSFRLSPSAYGQDSLSVWVNHPSRASNLRLERKREPTQTSGPVSAVSRTAFQKSPLGKQPRKALRVVSLQKLRPGQHHRGRQGASEAHQFINRSACLEHVHFAEGNAALRKKLFRQATLPSVHRRVDHHFVQPVHPLFSIRRSLIAESFILVPIWARQDEKSGRVPRGITLQCLADRAAVPCKTVYIRKGRLTHCGNGGNHCHRRGAQVGQRFGAAVQFPEKVRSCAQTCRDLEAIALVVNERINKRRSLVLRIRLPELRNKGIRPIAPFFPEFIGTDLFYDVSVVPASRMVTPRATDAFQSEYGRRRTSRIPVVRRCESDEDPVVRVRLKFAPRAVRKTYCRARPCLHRADYPHLSKAEDAQRHPSPWHSTIRGGREYGH